MDLILYLKRWGDFLKEELLSQILTVNVSKEKTILSKDIFSRLKNIALVDKYEAYQLLDNEWEGNKGIRVDIEIIQTEGFNATKVVDPNMVMKKVKGRDQEVQEGWKGRILPFELVQETYLQEELEALKNKENRLVEISSDYEELIDLLTEEEKDSKLLNDNNDAFVSKEVNLVLKGIFADVESEEINGLKSYLLLLDNKAKKPEKMDFINSNKQINWSNIDANKDGTFGKGAVNKYIVALQTQFTFPEDSFENKMVRTASLLQEEKDLKSQIKKEAAALHAKTKDTIEALTDEEVYELLELKWVHPIVKSMYGLPESIIDGLTLKLQALAEKYATTYSDVANEINKAENTLSLLLDDLTGNEFDMKGVK